MENNTTKVIFVHTPKAAGGSIHQWLKKYHEQYNFKYATAHKFLDVLREELPNEDFSFSCIRNTYNRMISLYVFSRHKLFFKLRKSYQRNNQEAITQYEQQTKELDKGIASWLEYAHENLPPVTTPLKEWVEGVDIILNQENLNEEFKIIQEKLNCFEPLETIHHRMDYDPKDFYSAEFKKVVENLYGDEIEKYKYLPKY